MFLSHLRVERVTTGEFLNFFLSVGLLADFLTSAILAMRPLSSREILPTMPGSSFVGRSKAVLSVGGLICTLTTAVGDR